MKKSFAFISLFLLLGVASIFADVTVKKLPDGNAEVTFFYGNPRATEVLLAGDFTDWQNGALPMEKGEKGFTLVKTFGPKDELRYKFISDGNWTTDLKAPDFVDDGFGGKNSHVVIADMLGGDDSGDSKAKINFVSWTMIGVQGNYLTQGAYDKSSKGLDLDSVTFGMKSYDKFVGNFLPNCPVYVEIALAEREMENYDKDQMDGIFRDNLNYIYKNDKFGNAAIDWEDGLKNFVNGIAAAPVEYVARAFDNNGKTDSYSGAIPGPGSNPFLGHLKFGFNTPYINYMTGFNYAKPDVRSKVLWTTISGNWDAGYEHAGGFNVFSLGDKAVAGLEEKTGIKFDIGFAPNKTADRKGKKYGYWAWAGIQKDNLVVDFQSNGMYDGLLFDDPVEHDFILGAKDEFEVGDGKLNIALQGLLATHQKDTKCEVGADGKTACVGDLTSTTDYFGYSTDVFYRTGDISGIKNFAAQAKVGYKMDLFNVNLSYRMRGAQASMLYVRENHDDDTFDLSKMLGELNTQIIDFNGSLNLMDSALGINLGVKAKMPLENLSEDEEFNWDNYNAASGAWESWYKNRNGGEMKPLFDQKGGVELTFKPSVSFNAKDATDIDMTFGVYGDMNYKAYTYADENKTNDYSVSDSPFRLKFAGLTFNYKASDKDAIVKGVDVFYGFDNENDVRNFNTLVGQVKFPADQAVTLALGLKTINSNDAAKASDYEKHSDWNNPFAFAVGYAKKFKAMKKPTVYAQFVYNMDPFKHFGDGQDALNIDRANVCGSWAKEGCGSIDAVDFYDGRAAVRVGIRWDI